MYKFSKRSMDILDKVNPKLKELAVLALKYSKQDFTVYHGLRTKEEQRTLIREKKSWTMNSKHLVGKAIDVVAYPVDFQDIKKYEAINEAFSKASKELGIPYRWGGDWNQNGRYTDEIKRGTFDGVHFELM